MRGLHSPAAGEPALHGRPWWSVLMATIMPVVGVSVRPCRCLDAQMDGLLRGQQRPRWWKVAEYPEVCASPVRVRGGPSVMVM